MTDELHEQAAELGRRGGLKGGRARADSMTAGERSESARRAARARWDSAAEPVDDARVLDHLIQLLADREPITEGCPACDVIRRRVREARETLGAANQMRDQTAEPIHPAAGSANSQPSPDA